MQNGKGSKNRISNIKKFKDNYENIEFRKLGTFCEECGATLKNPFNKRKHLSETEKGETWVCNKNYDCNRN